MAFLIHSTDDGHVPAWEYLPASAITPKVGMALTMSSGKLALASGTTVPKYICMTERASALTAGDIIPVIAVTDDIVFGTENSAALTEAAIGTKVTLATDGLRVTATATDGVAEIVGLEGTAIGSVVKVRFR